MVVGISQQLVQHKGCQLSVVRPAVEEVVLWCDNCEVMVYRSCLIPDPPEGSLALEADRKYTDREIARNVGVAILSIFQRKRRLTDLALIWEYRALEISRKAPLVGEGAIRKRRQQLTNMGLLRDSGRLAEGGSNRPSLRIWELNT